MKDEIRKQIDKMMDGLDRESILSMICQMSDAKTALSPKDLLKKMIEDGFFVEQISEGKPTYQFTEATVSILEAFAFTAITSPQSQLRTGHRGIKKW